jgi:hypothetical protein
VIQVVNSLRFDGVGKVGGEETAAGVVELGTMVEEMELESGRAESLKGNVEAVVGSGPDMSVVVAGSGPVNVLVISGFPASAATLGGAERVLVINAEPDELGVGVSNGCGVSVIRGWLEVAFSVRVISSELEAFESTDEVVFVIRGPSVELPFVDPTVFVIDPIELELDSPQSCQHCKLAAILSNPISFRSA